MKNETKKLEKLLKDLNKGQVNGLEEKYHEIKSKNQEFSADTLREIFDEVEINYNLHFTDIINKIGIKDQEDLKKIKVSQIISMLIEYCTQQIQEITKKPEENLIIPSKLNLKTVQFGNMSFKDYQGRIELQNDWIMASLPEIPPKALLKELLSLCKIQALQSELKEFSKELKKYPEYTSYILSDMKSILYSWYQACHSTQDLRSKVLNTISELEFFQTAQLSNYEKTALKDLLDTFKSKLKEIPASTSNETTFEDKCITGLHNIFNYYSKQQFLIGKTPTFDVIKSNTEMLTIGKFIRFSKDFKVIEDKDKTQTKKMLEIVQKVFKQSADCGKYMYEHHFIKGIELLSIKFFDEEYDIAHNTNWKSLPTSQKKMRFYEYLECFDPNLYTQKLKGSLPHFGVETYDRIPDYDLSKKYKPRPEKFKKIKISLDEWKKKQKSQKDNNNILHSVRNRPNEEIKTGKSNLTNRTPEIVNWEELGKVTKQQIKDFEFEDFIQNESDESSSVDHKPNYPEPKNLEQEYKSNSPKYSLAKKDKK